jgi:hypothetical protein
MWITRPAQGTEIDVTIVAERRSFGRRLTDFPSEGPLRAPIDVDPALARPQLEWRPYGPRRVEVVWKVPPGENAELLDLADEPIRWARGQLERRERDWESGWPFGEAIDPIREFHFDPARPPSLRIRHPYLVGARANDVIRLENPRLAVTLRVEAGPLVRMRIALPEGSPPIRGAFVTLAPRSDPAAASETRHALRRGEEFVLAPPPAGEQRVLVDPIVAVPVELERVLFDGGPQDLGELRFTRGSTLRVRTTVPPPFVAPVLHVRAIRLDGPRYERAGLRLPAIASPGEAEIGALGKGRFLVLLEADGSVRRTWSTEVELDGVEEREVVVPLD